MLLLFVESVVGTTFALAVVLELVRPGDTMGFLAELGIPSALRPPTVAVAALAEAAVTIAMVTRGPFAVPGLALAAVLLVAFTLGLARLLSEGVEVPCPCFGRSRTPVQHAIRSGEIRHGHQPASTNQARRPA